MSAINSIEVEEPEMSELNEQHGFYRNFQEHEPRYLEAEYTHAICDNAVMVRSRASSAANVSRRSGGEGIKSENWCWKCCKKCCLCTCTVIFVALVVAIVVLIVFHYSSKYEYNKEEMGALQPKLLARVQRLLDKLHENNISDYSNSSVLQDFDNTLYDYMEMRSDSKYKIVRNSTCYTRPCLEASIELLESMDFATDPCTDFYTFACGGWMRKYPSTQSTVASDHFNLINAKVAQATQKIMESPQNFSHPKGINLAKQFYAECNDLDKLESDGLQPLLSIINDYGGWPILYGRNWKGKDFDWIVASADLQRMGNPSILAIDLRQYPTVANLTAIFIVHGNFFIPREYLTGGTTGKHQRVLSAYKEHVKNVASILSQSMGLSIDPARTDRDIEDMIDFEKELAKSAKDEETRTSHPQTFYDIPKLQVETDMFTSVFSVIKIDWTKFLDQVFSSSGVDIKYNERLVVQDLKLVYNLVRILNQTPKETVANYLMWRLLSKLMTGTTRSLRQLVFKFNQKVYGLMKKPERSTSCAFLVNEKFSVALGYEFLKNSGDHSQLIHETEELIESIKGATEDLLLSQTFIPKILKSGITNKMQQIRQCVGFPKMFLQDKAVIKYYDTMNPGTQTTYLHKYMYIVNWLYDKNLRTLRQPFDLRCWQGTHMSFIGEAYAYYDTARSLIHFSLGLLQPPFYRRDAPAYLNYGSLGSIVGHELTHGLNLEGWMKVKLAAELEYYVKCLIGHYSSYRVPEAGNDTMLTLDGERTRYENFADQLGLAEAYYAYQEKLSVEGGTPLVEDRLPGLEMFTPAQTFFISFSHMWCLSGSPEWVFDELESSSHAPAKYRVLGTLRNSKNFAKQWNCPLGSYMKPYPNKFSHCPLF